MPSYLHPGVYVEEISSGSKPIEAVGTSTAIFIGAIEKGPMAYSDDPELITSWSQYLELFGGPNSSETAVSGTTHSTGDSMGLSVFSFFQNGGTKAYIARIALVQEVDGLDTLSAVKSSNQFSDGGDTPSYSLTFTAINEGTWGDDITVRLTSKNPGVPANDQFKLEIGGGTGDTFVAKEVINTVTLDNTEAEYIESAVNGISDLVTVNFTGNLTNLLAAINTDTNPDAGIVEAIYEIVLAGGSNGTAPGLAEYQAVFTKMKKIRDINIVMIPDQTWDGAVGKSIIEAGIAHCEFMKNRMVVFDLPPGTELENENDVVNLQLTTSTYATCYYPWPVVSNPNYNADLFPGRKKTLVVPSAPFAAGLWAKTDSLRGVWKAPAGVENGLLGVSKLMYKVEDEEQDYLNPQGVNALRALPNYGSVVWGTRTRSTKANPEWRYVPVRRTAMMIEESIFNGIQWAVFEPNDHKLWSALRANIGSFMEGLFQAGAFQGQKASDAYFVQCGLGATMSQGDIDRGQVIVQVGFAPLKPAEFVIVRIQQKVEQQ